MNNHLNKIRLIIKEYSLLFLIALTFILESTIYLKMKIQEPLLTEAVSTEVIEAIIILILKNTSQLSILMLVTTFFYLLLEAIFFKTDVQKPKQLQNESTNNTDESNESSVTQEKKCDKNDFSGILTRLLIGSFGASTIPTGISLTLCAFNYKKYITHLSGVEIYIAFAGISLISIAVLSIYEEKGRIKQEIEKIKRSDDTFSMLEKQNDK
jgi:hypothetical protein